MFNTVRELRQFVATLKPGDYIKYDWYNRTLTGKIICLMHSVNNKADVHDILVIPDSPEKHSSLYTLDVEDIDIESAGSTWLSDIAQHKNTKYFYLDYMDIKGYAHDPAGCKCKGCQLFIDWAAPNQPDNTFICYSCKSNPIRTYY